MIIALALLAAGLITAVLWFAFTLQLVALLFMLGTIGMAVALLYLPYQGVRLLDHLEHQMRAWRWRKEEGHYHEFEGTGLSVLDDGRDVWVAGADLQRALRTQEPEDAFAARHSERWYRDADGRLWVRVDAVVERMATMPGRDEPRTQRLRRYFERQVLYPASERRRRSR